MLWNVEKRRHEARFQAMLRREEEQLSALKKQARPARSPTHGSRWPVLVWWEQGGLLHPHIKLIVTALCSVAILLILANSASAAAIA